MGSFIEINDTLKITRKQGFPSELTYKKHKVKAFKAKDFKNKIFEFKNKPKIRIFKIPPVRNFLVEYIGNKWLYWGHVQIIEVIHDNIKKTTSGKFKITHIYSPEEMKQAHKLIDRNKNTDYLKVM
jgi:hypothetical protein